MKTKIVNEPDNELLAELKEYMAENEITQEDAAHMIGVSWITVNRWLNNQTKTLHRTTEMAIRTFMGRKRK